jgi:aspartate/methionine/tyrosine aminotransferase
VNERLRPSGVRAVFDRANALEAEGRSIVHLEIGRPTHDSPPVAKAAAVAALEAGRVHYTENRGDLELRVALGEALAARGAGAYDPATEVVVTAGGSEAVAATMLALLEPGDEVVVLEPAWPHYGTLVGLAHGVPVRVALDAADGFQPDPERVAAAIGPRTRMLIVSSPNNPTGAVFDPERLEALAELARRHDLLVLSDEIYEAFAYGDARHVSIASRPGMRDRTVICESFSKTYAMTGWRVGSATAPAALSARINVVHQHLSICAPSFAQAGALAALRDGADHVRGMVADYAARRDELLAWCAGRDDVELVPPAGAFYAFPRIAGADALALLEEAGVAVVPGEAFGADFTGFLRISYAVSREQLAEGLRRVAGHLG